METPDTMPETMRGAVLVGPERIEIREVPVERPGRGEILLRVEAATTCGTDVKVFRRGGHPRMLQVPTLFGHEMAGRVAVLGPGSAHPVRCHFKRPGEQRGQGKPQHHQNDKRTQHPHRRVERG